MYAFGIHILSFITEWSSKLGVSEFETKLLQSTSNNLFFTPYPNNLFCWGEKKRKQKMIGSRRGREKLTAIFWQWNGFFSQIAAVAMLLSWLLWGLGTHACQNVWVVNLTFFSNQWSLNFKRCDIAQFYQMDFRGKWSIIYAIS